MKSITSIIGLMWISFIEINSHIYTTSEVVNIVHKRRLHYSAVLLKLKFVLCWYQHSSDTENMQITNLKRGNYESRLYIIYIS